METNEFSAPQDWRKDTHWFERVTEGARRAFAQEHCNVILSCEGQACVIVSYPRHDGTVLVYDMDGGRFFRVPLTEARVGGHFESACRTAEEADFEWSAISSHDVTDEAHDISCMLFGGY
jgi:hypothetical protein